MADFTLNAVLQEMEEDPKPSKPIKGKNNECWRRYQVDMSDHIGAFCYANSIFQYMLHDDGSSMTGVLYWILRNILDAEQKKLSKNYGGTEPLVFQDTSFHKDLQNDCHSFLISLLKIIKRDNKMFNKIPTFDHDEKPRETTRKLQYKLFGVIIHLGNLEEGHYITYVRSADESCDWLLCDGDAVSHCSKEVVFDWTKTCAYILFYHKEG
ncbi:hypothetical protein KUTeg_007748 [Tegillarca granosa]|uniref:USP domain-containing protein n=1 Tax=Tegillarca granosa TaxID=220873 RepID=A0ABQ9FIN5_TEGGR|nr:hypothetical protein KUTeg_007748 [Tegillarca granosa]